MKTRHVLPLCLCVLASLHDTQSAVLEREPLEVYRLRRLELLKELNAGPTVLFGLNERDVTDTVLPFRQEDNFFYLTGFSEPGAILMLLPPARDEADRFPREILFLPPKNPQNERWNGPKLGPKDEGVERHVGFDAVLGADQFEAELKRAMASYQTIYTLLPPPRGGERSVAALNSERLKALAPAAELKSARQAIVKMRTVKSPTEIALLQKAADCSVAAHLEAMRFVRPGVWEYQVAAAMHNAFAQMGCVRPAYPPIVGSGFFSTVLHYADNNRRMEAGDLVVMDVAGEYSGYAADVTRTLPVSGKFTARQREIYEIVLGAQKAAIAAVKPGMTLGRGENSLQKIAMDHINAQGKDRHGQPLGKYFIHGLSHHVGLNVHDPNDGSPLKPGMVFTIEPGIYIPEESLGVRIEDMILVTETGGKLLTAALPREVAEIERLMSRGASGAR